MNVIKPSHRDLLGGSNTDLSNIGDKPLKPAEKADENYIEYCDPFDTGIYTTEPGQTELKFLEKELLSDIKKETNGSLSDEDFDPRAVEEKPRERTQSRPEILNISATKTVSFDLPTPTEEFVSSIKPLTPYYVRKESIAEVEESVDPFDTSFVSNIAPGKAELKLIENDLFDPELELKHSISDQNFDPRDEKQVAVAAVVQTINEIYNPKPTPKVEQTPQVDLLALEHETEVKALTPAPERKDLQFSVDSFQDPFDTSIASNILPGKTELKLLETELIDSEAAVSAISSETSADLLSHSKDSVIDKPLSPVTKSANTDLENICDDFDPFDTSIASNILPGRTELKLIESELM